MLFAIFAACSFDGDSKVSSEDAISTADTAGVQLSEDIPINGRNILLHDGVERSYRLHIPENVTENAPLVVVMHGYSSSASVIEEYSEMNRIADENGFVVVYPQGTKDDNGYHFFNVGYDFHSGVDVDDMGYIHALIDHMQETLSVSQQNVFSTGMSNGGDMSYMLACQSDKIRAIAPISGCMMKHLFDSCEPAQSIPVLEIHGTLDDVTLIEGDLENQGGWGAYMPLSDTIQFWVDHNELEQSETIAVANSNNSDGSTVMYHRYYSASSSNTAEVWLYEVVDGGHDWPGAFGNQDIDASQLAWDFFSLYLD